MIVGRVYTKLGGSRREILVVTLGLVFGHLPNASTHWIDMGYSRLQICITAVAFFRAACSWVAYQRRLCGESGRGERYERRTVMRESVRASSGFFSIRRLNGTSLRPPGYIV